MKPLRVLVVTKNSPRSLEREIRACGFFSYPVPEFVWDFTFIGPTNALSLVGHYDLVAYEDGSETQPVVSGLPTICFVIDSTLSERHYQVRARRAKHVDVVLVDHDDLSKYAGRVHRFLYCVNDHLFRDYGEAKTVDVSFHCGVRKMPERSWLLNKLDKFCSANGYTYKHGGLQIAEYARAMARSKVVANWLRTPTNRPHRIFDAPACGAMLATGSIPFIAEDNLLPDRDYISVHSQEDMLCEIQRLLSTGAWQEIAATGYRNVMENHTWAVRATQLRQLISQEFGL